MEDDDCVGCVHWVAPARRRREPVPEHEAGAPFLDADAMHPSLLSGVVTPETRLIAIGAPGDVHITRQLFAAFQAGRQEVPRLSVTTPLGEMVEALNAYQPEALIAYASVVGALADEQVEGPAADRPEPDLDDVGGADRRDQSANRSSVVVLKVVGESYGPVLPGVPAAKVLLTSLVNRVQPLIRYELTDAIVLAKGPDPSGRPYLRIARVDGRSSDILRFPAAAGGEVAVHPYRLRAPFSAIFDVRQYQIVHAPDGLRVRIGRPHRPASQTVFASPSLRELEGGRRCADLDPRRAGRAGRAGRAARA